MLSAVPSEFPPLYHQPVLRIFTFLSPVEKIPQDTAVHMALFSGWRLFSFIAHVLQHQEIGGVVLALCCHLQAIVVAFLSS